MPEALQPESIDLGVLRLTRSAPEGGLFTLHHTDLQAPVTVKGPIFEIDGRPCAAFEPRGPVSQTPLPGGGQETRLTYACADLAGLTLTVRVRSFTHSPVLRFVLRLDAVGARFTPSAPDRIRYFSLSQPGLPDGVLNTGSLTEYQLSHFDPVIHSYLPNRVTYRPEDRLPGLSLVGPVALFHTPHQTLLAAYEHGADHPDSFFDFICSGGAASRAFTLQSRKGHTFSGQPVNGWESVWFELGLHPAGLDAFLPFYRRFFLNEVCENRESRAPYIYYNTWNYQERQKYFKGRPYLESMHANRMLAEIDVAHRLGVDVFVVDTGWYHKTGDWLPDLNRFPEGLREIKRRLDGYGMKLGLWFNPTVAALTSAVFTQHPEWEMTWDGQPRWRGPIWETEESTGMCLASDYASDYIEVMVRLHRELGVSYFKWDAVQQYGCNSPHHHHGGADTPPAERADCYAYQMGRSMIRIVEEVTRRCPGVIVDFDITEGGRFVGLGFLSVGKFFLVNNGPYFGDFNIPPAVKIDPDTINVFFYPGPARPRICRTGARFDELIPSILFLTHYLPDPPELAQRNTLAALVLGGNGLWGDLPALGDGDIAGLSAAIERYKRVSAGVTQAYPRRSGFAGSSPEIHEKLSPEQPAGVVVFFTVTPGTVTHITQPLALDTLGEVYGADAWERVEGGRLKITVTLAKDDARIVYVIPKEVQL